MNSFEEILCKTKSAIGVVGEKAGQIVNISKLTLNLAELKMNRRKKIEELGEKVYLSRREGQETKDSDFLKISAEIESLDKDIENLNLEISRLKNKIICKNCGNNNNMSHARYCCGCGKKLENVANQVDENDTEDLNSKQAEKDIS